jgi:hypothetical protein
MSNIRGSQREDRESHPSLFDGQALDKLCKETLASAGDTALVARLREAYPEYPLNIARRGHQWYRLGGIIKADGTRIAPDVNEWVERTFLECGQNFNTLLDYCEEEGFLVTQHTGVSLYLVAQTGSAARDFVQIEVDRTQEFAQRHLIDPDQPPEDSEELIDPMSPLSVEPFAVGPARYTYRRKTDVGLFMRELGRHRATPHPAQRFMDDWDVSSAGQMKVFCEDWSLRLFQHIGRHGEQIMNVEIVQNRVDEIPRLEGPEGKRGKGLASLLSRFDSQAGFPFSWYFYMLKGLVSPHVGEAVHRDLSGDYGYLPARDAAVLKHWADAPYCL